MGVKDLSQSESQWFMNLPENIRRDLNGAVEDLRDAGYPAMRCEIQAKVVRDFMRTGAMPNVAAILDAAAERAGGQPE